MILLSKFRISGHSMIPTYYPHDEVLISSLPYIFSKPKVGEIIVFQKGKLALIKRIKKITKNGLIVEGDNRGDSLKSSEMGVVLPKQVIGKVIVKL